MKLESVVVSAKVNAISLLFVVVIVLPLLYAVCNPCEDALQVTIWFDASIQSDVPDAEVSPVTAKYELLVGLVFMVTLLLVLGVNVEAPFAVSVCPFDTVAPPLNVARPVAVKALFTVVVPVPAPRLRVVATPPMLRVVALALNRFAVVAVVESVPPFAAMLPAVVTLPLFATVNSVVPE